MKLNPLILALAGMLSMVHPSSAIAFPQTDEAIKALDRETLKPSAEEILKKAADVQGGKEIVEKGLKNFKAQFLSEFKHPEKGKIYYEVTRIFQLPSFLWTKKKHEHHKNPTWEVYNGTDGWFINFADGKKNVTVYTDKPATYQTDIKNLEEDVRITKQMFKFFFIANLQKEINDMTRLPDKPLPMAKKDDRFYVVGGKTTGWIGGKDKKTIYINIFIDPKNYQVRAVWMEDLGLNGKERLFLFDKYRKNRQGVMIPGKISMLSNDSDAGIPEMKITLDGDAGEDGKPFYLIDFNVELDANLFNIPEDELD